MRYPAAEKLEIIRLVEQSRLPVRRTLDKLGILPARFYRWYDRYQSGGYEALKDRPPRPKQADVYFERGQTILLERERIKRKTIEHRRLQHRDAAA